MAPERFPMVDTRTAKWVLENRSVHNAADPDAPELMPPKYPANGATVLTFSDWKFVESFREWCNYTARKLTALIPPSSHDTEWRARDVEMAIFQAQGSNLKLPPLP